MIFVKIRQRKFQITFVKQPRVLFMVDELQLEMIFRRICQIIMVETVSPTLAPVCKYVYRLYKCLEMFRNTP